jgi:hypothetical protein
MTWMRALTQALRKVYKRCGSELTRACMRAGARWRGAFVRLVYCNDLGSVSHEGWRFPGGPSADRSGE